MPLYASTVSHGPGCELQLGPDATLVSEEAGECQGPDGLVVVVELVVVVLLLGVALLLCVVLLLGVVLVELCVVLLL